MIDRITRPVIWGLCILLCAFARPGYVHSQIQPDLVIMPHDTLRQFGMSLASGDLDADGRDEIIIGTPVYDAYGDPLTGNVHVVFGDQTLPDTIRLFERVDRWTHFVSGPEIDAGYSLCCANLNGDLMDDLIIGAPQTTVEGMYERGLVYIVNGKIAGWEYDVNLEENAPSSTILGRDEGDQFGTSLTAGDFNGDGVCDLAAGAIGLNREVHMDLITGAVFYLLQDSLGFPANVDLTTFPDSVMVEIWGENNNDRFGWALDSRDVNGDGYDDCLIGAYKYNYSGATRDEGCCYLIPGDSSLLKLIVLEESDADRKFTGRAFIEHMGWSVMIEDVNNDGYPDLCFGSQQAHNGNLQVTGRIRVLFGSDQPFEDTDFKFDTPDLLIEGVVEYAQMGYTMACADMNGDGKKELLVSAPQPVVADATSAGEVYLWKGRMQWPAQIDLSQESPDLVLSGMEIGDWFGAALTSGDFNGDNLADIAVSAPKADSSGVVYVYFGTSETHVSAPEWRPELLRLHANFPNPFNHQTVISFNVPAPFESGQLQLFDVRGRLIRSWDLSGLVPGGGSGQVRWDSRDEAGNRVSSGVYLCMLRVGNQRTLRRITLLK
jgi:hypothetical protein